MCFIWDVPATSLGRIERRCYDVAMTSCCRVGDVDLKAIKQIEFVRQLKNPDDTVVANESMFV